MQAGLVRRNWGAISDDYGKAAGTVAYRRGLTSKITVEGNSEGTPGTFMAGAGGDLQIGNLGIVNIALAGSSGSRGPGGLATVGAQRIGRVLNLGASVTMAQRNFQDVAALNGDPFPRKQLNGNVGLSLRRFGSLGAAYATLDKNTHPTTAVLPAPPHPRTPRSFPPAIRSSSIMLPSSSASFAMSGVRTVEDCRLA